MSSYFPFDGISPIAQLLQDEAGDMCLTGIDKQGRPYTQLESEYTQTQYSTQSGAHTYLETVFTQASTESAGPMGNDMPNAPVGCPRVPSSRIHMDPMTSSPSPRVAVLANRANSVRR